MSLSVHVLTRVYGFVQGSPPFQNSAGATNFSNVKPFPIAPNSYIPTNNATLWPLQNGFNIATSGVPYYVYSVIELPPTGLNQPSIKLVTDKSVGTLATDAS